MIASPCVFQAPSILLEGQQLILLMVEAHIAKLLLKYRTKNIKYHHKEYLQNCTGEETVLKGGGAYMNKILCPSYNVCVKWGGGG